MSLLLPRGEDRAGDAAIPSNVDLETHEKTIMIVEDDDDLRAVVARFLASLGYNVLDAGSGVAALRVLADAPHLDLLLPDIVLPDGLSGLQVSEVLRGRYPEVKSLFMSGYPTAMRDQGDAAFPRAPIIGKPFELDDLAVRVGKALTE